MKREKAMKEAEAAHKAGVEKELKALKAQEAAHAQERKKLEEERKKHNEEVALKKTKAMESELKLE